MTAVSVTSQKYNKKPYYIRSINRTAKQ